MCSEISQNTETFLEAARISPVVKQCFINMYVWDNVPPPDNNTTPTPLTVVLHTVFLYFVFWKKWHATLRWMSTVSLVINLNEDVILSAWSSFVPPWTNALCPLGAYLCLHDKIKDWGQGSGVGGQGSWLDVSRGKPFLTLVCGGLFYCTIKQQESPIFRNIGF